MALKKRGKNRYGDGPDDIAAEIRRYSEANACGLTAVHGDWKNEHEDHVALLARA